MQFKKLAFILVLVLATTAQLSWAQEPSPAELLSGAPQEVPISGMVTMVDLGAHSCVPCKMMTPILKELSEEYTGRAAIVFIDVWQNRHVAQSFGISSIPTQIFYDAGGKEVFRHVGFFSKEKIKAQFAQMGVK